MSGSTLSTRRRIERVAEVHGWSKDHKTLNRTTYFERGKQFITVVYNARGGVQSARVGKLGGWDITGRGKADKVVEVLSRWIQET